MQGNILGSGDTAEHSADQVFCSHRAQILVRRVIDNKHIKIRQFQTEATVRKEIKSDKGQVGDLEGLQGMPSVKMTSKLRPEL